MKKFLTLLILSMTSASYAMTSEFFENTDVNAVKAGISKYILTKGGKIDHGESYDANTFQAFEQIQTKYGTYIYYYAFNLVPSNNGTRLDLIVSKASQGSKPSMVDEETEKKVMEKIKASLKGRFLYGLGFEFEIYNTPEGKIKAPKGRETGIKLTAVKYDALKKGLMAGDIITEINGVPLNQIPIKEYAVILFAQNMTDSITLTYKRGKETGVVTLIPRSSNTRVF